MKKDAFHKEMNETIQSGIGNTGLPMDRMKELARKALDLAEESGDEISDVHVAELREEYPDVFGKGLDSESSESRLPKGSRR